MLGSWKASDNWKQTVDYSIPISQQFPDKNYPIGEIMDHPGDFNMKRTSNAEYKDRDRLYDS